MIPNAERADAADAQSALAGLVGTVNSVCGRLVSDFTIDGRPSAVAEVMSGRIKTNDTPRRLTADWAAAVAGSTSNTTNRGPVTFSPTFHITGGNPKAVADQIDNRTRRFLAELEAEQRGYLSD